MVQPKYNPLESLQRVKLLMKYNTEKTLTENVSTIFESNDPPEKYYQIQIPKESDILQHDLNDKKVRKQLTKEMGKKGFVLTFKQDKYGFYHAILWNKQTDVEATLEIKPPKENKKSGKGKPVEKSSTWVFNPKSGKIKDVKVTSAGIMLGILLPVAAYKYLLPSGEENNLEKLLKACTSSDASEVGRRSMTVLSGTEVSDKVEQLSEALHPDNLLEFGTNFSRLKDSLVAEKMKWGDVCKVKEAFESKKGVTLFQQLTDVLIRTDDIGIFPELSRSQMIELVTEIQKKFDGSEVPPSEFSTGKGWLNNFKCLKENYVLYVDLDPNTNKGIQRDQNGNYYIQIQFSINDTSQAIKLFLLRSDGTVCEHMTDVSKRVPKEICKMDYCTNSNISWGKCNKSNLFK